MQTDKSFNALLPDYLKAIAGIQFTPVDVALKAAEFLAVKSGSKVLDIGSGAGKFCLIGASRFPSSDFVGVEQRKDLYECSVQLAAKLGLNNVNFILSDIKKHNLQLYNGFYFYNSFHENLVYGNVNNLDYSGHEESVFDSDGGEEDFSTDRYISYSDNLRSQLRRCKTGSRLVTYHSVGLEVPENYKLVEQHFESKLSFWIKNS